jgi:hypothetical protein
MLLSKGLIEEKDVRDEQKGDNFEQYANSFSNRIGIRTLKYQDILFIINEMYDINGHISPRN